MRFGGIAFVLLPMICRIFPGECVHIIIAIRFSQCRNTGYLGRLGIFEIFPMSAQLKKLIATRANDNEFRQIAIREGMTTLREQKPPD